MVAGAIALLGSAPAASALVGRAQAARIALRALHPARHDDTLVVFGLPTPLRAGSLVFGATPRVLVLDGKPHRIPTRPLRHPAWLFFEDLEYSTTGDQSGMLVLVDAASGRVVRKDPLYSAPLIDGHPASFMRSAAAYDTQRGAVFSEALRISRPRRHHRAAAVAGTAAASVIPPGYLKDDCMVSIGNRTEADPGFAGDLADAEEWARSVGMRDYVAPARSARPQLQALINQATSGASPCRNIVLVVAGHGYPAPGSIHGLLYSVAALPTVALAEPTTATVGGQLAVTSYPLTSTDLAAILRSHPRTQFEILLASCFSGRFINSLSAAQQNDNLDNLLVTGTQANASEFSFGHLSQGRTAGSGQLIANPSSPRQQPVPESDWMHAIVSSMGDWAHDHSIFYGPGPFPFADTPIGLVGGLKLALGEVPFRDFPASRLRTTHPQYRTGDLVKTYTYSMKASVSDGKEAFKAFYTGSATANWTGTWNRVWIVVDRARRLAITAVSPPTDGAIHPEKNGDTTSDSFTGSASGSWTDNGGHACTYAGLTPHGQNALRGAGGDTYGETHPYLVEDSYQFAGTIGMVFNSDGSSGDAACSSSDNPAYTEAPYHPFIGADICNSPRDSRSTGVPVPAWDLGKAQIHVESPFAGDLTGGCPIRGYGADATSSGTYKVDLTRTPGT